MKCQNRGCDVVVSCGLKVRCFHYLLDGFKDTQVETDPFGDLVLNLSGYEVG